MFEKFHEYCLMGTPGPAKFWWERGESKGGGPGSPPPHRACCRLGRSHKHPTIGWPPLGGHRPNGGTHVTVVLVLHPTHLGTQKPGNYLQDFEYYLGK